MQHTPGPWHTATAQDRTYPHAIESRDSSFDGFQLARCVNPADARLIAAAPDLLASLLAVLPHVPGHLTDNLHGRPWIEQARAAIAKATGA